MLQIILIALYALLVGLIEEPYAKRIQKCNSLEEAINIRKKCKNIRYASVLIFILINFVASFFIQFVKTGDINIWSIVESSIITTVTGYFIVGGINSHKEFNPISFLTFKDFTKIKGNYSLFLRGFNTDDYSSKQDVSLTKKHLFSEFTLSKVLLKKLPLFAVGMTKELTSPEGAKRIYLSDDSWKEDVLDLMQNASAIFILVNGKDSCVWEIEQSMSMLEKTCFVVDDLAQYEVVKMKLGDTYRFPSLININEELPFAYRFVNDGREVKFIESENIDTMAAQLYTFENTEKGYTHFIQELFGIYKKRYLHKHQ